MSDTPLNIRARFFREPVENAARTKEEGRPIFEDVEMIELAVPGDRLSRHVALADEWSDNRGNKYRDKYPVEYAAFKNGEAVATKGTPLEHWPLITRARVLEMKAMGIMTVDELAVISDHLVTRIGADGRNLREQALAFITQAKDGAAGAAQAAQIAELKAEIERMKASMAAAVTPQQPAPQPQEKDVADASDDELKAYIKRMTGQAPRGMISRETLLARVEEIATSQGAEEAA